MTKRQPEAAVEPPAGIEIDPRSDAVLLFYVGGGGIVPGADPGTPPTDLTANEVARLAYLRDYRVTATDGQRPDHRHPDPATVASVVADLVATGGYSPDQPPDAPAPEDTTTLVEPPTPDAPAPEEV